MNILLLEDSDTDADLTRRGLTSSIVNCNIVVAQSLKQAKEILLKNLQFDIAILDMKLPDGTGLEMLMEIRQSGSDMPVVFLTGSGNEEMAAVALKSGADDYIVKREDYLLKLPGVIDFTIRNHKQNKLLMSEIIDVLYVEHHSADVDLTVRYLSQNASKIRITALSTAELALQQLPQSEAEECRFQVILVDYRLPGLNALEFTKIIRQERKLSIPIILVTGHGNENVAIQALKLGVNEYLVKRDNYLFRLPSMILNSHQHQELLKKQTALAESEEKYRYMFANNPQPMWIYDLETLAFLEINDAAINHYGYSKEDFFSMTIRDIRPVEDLDELLNNIEQSRDESYTSGEWRHVKKNGEIIIVEIISHLLEFNNRKARHVMVNDITKRRHAENELHKLSRAVEQSPNSIVITNIDGKIEYANPNTLTLTGYSNDDLIGKNPRIFSSGEKPQEEYSLLWNTILSGNEWVGEFHNKKKNGELYWESATISPILDDNGEVIHFLAIKKDISENKKLESDLLVAKEKAEESDRLKTAFLLNISHEIRTPMNGILGFAELLKLPGLTGDEQCKYNEIIKKSSDRMLNIINDIVDISKIESGQMKISISETNINAQIKNIHSLFLPESQKKGIEFLFVTLLSDEESVILTDRAKIFSILVHLVKNALKYTEKGTVAFGYSLKTGSASSLLEFYVKDTGIGIPQNRQQAIFDRFVQADISDSKAYQGAGLGLSISRAYAEMLGGKISVQSEVGVGSTFFLTLPFNPVYDGIAYQKNNITASKAADPRKKIKVLIVDDDESSAMFISILLKKYSEEILTAQNGLEAIEIYRDNTDLELIMMDMKMPVMDGFEATRQIRQHNRNVVIIAQTAYGLIGDREKAIDAGCNDYISKPISSKLLMELLVKYLGK
ncbi:MAG: response regulator [Bacteroidota bacterium]